jgi:hypothetical protein
VNQMGGIGLPVGTSGDICRAHGENGPSLTNSSFSRSSCPFLGVGCSRFSYPSLSSVRPILNKEEMNEGKYKEAISQLFNKARVLLSSVYCIQSMLQKCCVAGRARVAHTCNPSYSVGSDQKDCHSKPPWANCSETLS